jgi:hypothetical protein
MFQIADYKKTIDGILKEMPARSQDVLSRRFGIGLQSSRHPEKEETLEEIGNDYGITRERVRQIESKGLEAFQNSPKFSKIKEPFFEIKHFIDNNGGLKREDVLKSSLLPEPKYQPYLLFLLKIGDEFFYQPDSILFYSFWQTREDASKIANKVNDLLVKLFNKEKRLLEKEEILEMANKEALKNLRVKFPEDYIISYIEITKKIEENPFGEYGLSSWPEVTPKGVRDRAYLILKKEGISFHFKELAQAIEKELQESVQPNTLHNELIKNKEFVLVGRGTYGLREWGYQDGTVRDIIKAILKGGGELSKEEIIDEVKKQRIVKETTILLNLQYFKKTKNGKYTL